MENLKQRNFLFLEDNIGFAENTIQMLNLFFHEVYHTTRAKDAYEIFEDNKIDVILTDIKIDDGNGLDFVEQVRKVNDYIPIIVLSAHKDENFLFKAIPLKILSYELKPMNRESFKSMLDKIADYFNSKGVVSIYKNIKYDFNQNMIINDEESIKLSKKEVAFMELILNNKGRIVTKEMIQIAVWESELMSDSALKNLLLRLRKKVHEDFIETIHNVGFKIKE